jgi:DNA replication protein DnaC
VSAFRRPQDLLYKRYSLGDILKEENFARFSFNWYSDTIKDGPSDKTEMELARDAYDAAISFVAEIGKPDNNLFLYGNTGVGKTFLSHCIAKEALDRSLSVLYFSQETSFRFWLEQHSAGTRKPLLMCA